MASVRSVVTAADEAPVPKHQNLLRELASQARSQAGFACSEICKGLTILGVGDMVIADEVGELVTLFALMAHGAPSSFQAVWSKYLAR
jgi:hypothetical protein